MATGLNFLKVFKAPHVRTQINNIFQVLPNQKSYFNMQHPSDHIDEVKGHKSRKLFNFNRFSTPKNKYDTHFYTLVWFHLLVTHVVTLYYLESRGKKEEQLVSYENNCWLWVGG